MSTIQYRNAVRERSMGPSILVLIAIKLNYCYTADVNKIFLNLIIIYGHNCLESTFSEAIYMYIV